MTGPSFGGELDLPFEEGPPGQTMPFGDGTFASGLVLLAGTIPVPDVGVMACLIYRFANPDGSGFYPPIVLVVDDQQMAGITQLTAAASDAAVRTARQQRGA
jgi:hypothetical protein